MVVKVSLLSGAVTSDGALSIQTNAGTEAIGITTGQVISLAQNPILSAGTINGVAYLNGSKILTTGSALVFDGTNLGVGASPAGTWKVDVAGYVRSAAAAGGLYDAVYTGTTAGSTLGQLRFNGSGSGVTAESKIIGALNSGSITSSYMGFYTTASGAENEVMRLDSAGNLGLGVTPVASVYTSSRNFFVGQASNLIGRTTINFTSLNTNVYEAPTTSAATFINSSTAASQYQQYLGAHTWRVSTNTPSANTAIAWNDAMTLDASGQLVIGDTTADTKFNVVGGTARISGTRTAGSFLDVTPSNTGTDGVALGVSYYGSGNYGPLKFTTGGAERARIDSSGNFMVGTTTAVTGARLSSLAASGSQAAAFRSDASTSVAILNLWGNETSGNQIFVRFATDSNQERGSISYNRGAGLVAYNITSDYRAKDITGPVADSGTLIDSVPVYMGKMKGATQERPMFIAHEVPPYAHTGEKDAVDEDGNPIYQQMDTSALVPVMWAEIQSLRQRLAALEAK